MKIEKLERVITLNEELEIYKNELDSMYLKSPQLSGLPGSNNIADRTGDISIKKYEMESKIKRLLNEIQIVIKEIMDFVEDIEDSCIRQIIQYKYINNLEWEEVAACIGGGHTEESIRKLWERYDFEYGWEDK